MNKILFLLMVLLLSSCADTGKNEKSKDNDKTITKKTFYDIGDTKIKSIKRYETIIENEDTTYQLLLSEDYYISGNLEEKFKMDEKRKVEIWNEYWDDKNNSLKLEHHYNGKDEADSISNYRYGRLYSIEIFHRSEKLKNDSTIKYFDKNGNLIKIENITHTYGKDFEGGTTSNEFRETIIYNNGEISEKKMEQVIYPDPNDPNFTGGTDPTYKLIHHYFFDENGNMISGNN